MKLLVPQVGTCVAAVAPAGKSAVAPRRAVIQKIVLLSRLHANNIREIERDDLDVVADDWVHWLTNQIDAASITCKHWR